MKRLFFALILTAMVVVSTSAQEYLVYDVHGTVMLLNKPHSSNKKSSGKQKVERDVKVRPNLSLSPESIIKISDKSSVELIDVVKRKSYKCAQTGIATIEKLLISANTNVKELSVNYLKYLLNKLLKDTKNGKYNDDVTASLERETHLEDLLGSLENAEDTEQTEEASSDSLKVDQ